MDDGGGAVNDTAPEASPQRAWGAAYEGGDVFWKSQQVTKNQENTDLVSLVHGICINKLPPLITALKGAFHSAGR